MSLDLRRWDPSKEPTPFSALLLASRRSGKSFLIKHLWQTQWRKRFDVVMVMCPTDFQGYYASFIPGKLIFREYNPRALAALMIKQEQREERNEKVLKALVILDDCSDDMERYDDVLQKLYTKGRHYNISVVFSTQATQLTSNIWRNNSDYVVIGRQLGGNGRELVREGFLEGLADPEDDIPPDYKNEKRYLQALLKRHTVNHNFLVVTFSADSQNYDDMVFTYKA